MASDRPPLPRFSDRLSEVCGASLDLTEPRPPGRKARGSKPGAYELEGLLSLYCPSPDAAISLIWEHVRSGGPPLEVERWDGQDG